MKKLVIVFFLLSTGSYAYSQFSFGVKAGINVNDIVITGRLPGTVNYCKTNIAYHVGVYAAIKLSGKFSVFPELQFSRRGAAINNPVLPKGSQLYLNYLDLPVMISYRPFKSISFEVGPSFSYKISAVFRVNDVNNNFDRSYPRKVDIGIACGLRLHLNRKFSIIGRYYYGITPSKKDVFVTNVSKETLREHNSTIQFGIGYKLK